MDAKIILKNKPNVIGAASNFAYHWGLNSGLDNDRATRLAVAVSEIVTNIVLFAFVSKEGEIELTFNRRLDQVEVILHELGEPFSLERHQYNPVEALKNGNFKGAGFHLIKALSDDFIYINKGKKGKEFHLTQKINATHISQFSDDSEINEIADDISQFAKYDIKLVSEEDAEDVARLIYRTYGHSYYKETLYFPKQISLAIAQKEKFGVLAIYNSNEPVGSFSVSRSTDSNIGEVGEAVVSLHHRKKGIMSNMLGFLVNEARIKGLLGLWGEANAAHLISQKVNAKFGFQTCALILGLSLPMDMEGFDPRLASQRISGFCEFLIFSPPKEKKLCVPTEYKKLIKDIYHQFGTVIKISKNKESKLSKLSDISIKIRFEDKFALLVVQSIGQDFKSAFKQIIIDLEIQEIETIYIDFPLNLAKTKTLIPFIKKCGFIFSGIMPLFHQEKDYIRFQKLNNNYNFDLIIAYSTMASRLKNLVQTEYYEIPCRK